MKQLSGLDASFIYAERSHAPTHIMSVGIYDQSTAPGGQVKFKGILAHLEARLHLARAVPPEAGAGAWRSRPSLVGRGRR